MDCKVTTLDRDLSTPDSQSRVKSLPSKLKDYSSGKPYMFCLEANNGVKYYIQAASEEERSGWISDISTKILTLKEGALRNGSVLV